LEAEAGNSTSVSKRMGGTEKRTEDILSLVQMLMEERERESNRGKLAELETPISEVKALVRDQRLAMAWSEPRLQWKEGLRDSS
jgi:hypothetical protein